MRPKGSAEALEARRQSAAISSKTEGDTLHIKHSLLSYMKVKERLNDRTRIAQNSEMATGVTCPPKTREGEDKKQGKQISQSRLLLGHIRLYCWLRRPTLRLEYVLWNGGTGGMG